MSGLVRLKRLDLGTRRRGFAKASLVFVHPHRPCALQRAAVAWRLARARVDV